MVVLFAEKAPRTLNQKFKQKYLDTFVWMDQISEEVGIKISNRLNSGKEHFISGFLRDV